MTKGLAPWGLPLGLQLWSAWGISVRAESHMVSFTYSFCPKDVKQSQRAIAFPEGRALTCKMGIKLTLISENKPVRVELRANAGTAITALILCVRTCMCVMHECVCECMLVRVSVCMYTCVCWGFNSQAAWEHAEGEMSLLHDVKGAGPGLGQVHLARLQECACSFHKEFLSPSEGQTCAVAGEAKMKQIQFDADERPPKKSRGLMRGADAWGRGAGHQGGQASGLGWKEKYILPSGEGGRTLQAERTAGAKRECERAWYVWGR